MLGDICCLCGRAMFEWGNNPWPLAELDEHGHNQCCDECNDTKVLPARIVMAQTMRVKTDLEGGQKE